MGDYGTLKKALIKKALLISLAVACILLALDFKSAAKGVALGCLFSVVEFMLMARRLERRLIRQGDRDFFGLIGRYFLLAIPLIIALKLPSINFFATVGGIFAVKAAIFYHVLISNRHLSMSPEDRPS